MKEYFNIVDENDNIIGQESRERIHREGLLHQEIHVYFVTPNQEIIFQRRAKDKDTYPNMLDATTSGHVEIGDSYIDTVVKEVREETGLELNKNDFIFSKKVLDNNKKDNRTGKINSAFSENYIYNFSGKLSDLKIEEGKAIGFELWSFEKIKNLSEEEKSSFISYILSFVINNIIEK